MILQNSVDCNFVHPRFKLITQLIRRILKDHSFRAGDITLIFTSDAYLLSINKEFLNKEYLTDVITFDYNNANIVSGDIFISIDRVLENALLYNQTYDDELDRVIIHGVLHLAGYKDDCDENRQLMQGKEDHYLLLRKNYEG